MSVQPTKLTMSVKKTNKGQTCLLLFIVTAFNEVKDYVRGYRYKD